MNTSSAIFNPPFLVFSSEERYGSGFGSPAGRRNAAARNGASASIVTTHGETVVAKFFARNGPSGWYSHRWMSRADQSLSRQSPNILSSAFAIGIGSESLFPPPM